MRLKTLLLLSFMFSAHASAADPMANLTLANGCRLYDVYGKNLRSFPGAMCLYLDNGHLVSANENAIRLLDNSNQVLWEIKGHFHHQMNLTSDNKILALSSKTSGEGENFIREDKLMVIGLDGKVLHERTVTDIFKEAKSSPIMWRLDPHMRLLFGQGGHEISHLNSMYEIPANKGEKKLPYLAKGNIIINGLETGIHILSPDLSKVLHYTYLKQSVLHSLHDAQVNSRGNFLIFNNVVATEKKRATDHPNWRAFNGLHSEIQEIDPRTEKTIYRFSSSPKEMFYSKACGSVQELDQDTWLFTHILNGTYIYSKSKKNIIQSIPSTHLNDHQFIPAQQVKALDLRKFLSHWK